MNLTPLKRRILGVRRRFREARMFAKAMKSARHPILAHLIPTRRCNLACTYCNEYDHFSPPVPTAELRRRIDKLAALGTTIITVSGGEPLIHPEIDTVIRHIAGHGIIATLITNGTLLTRGMIRSLNRAGLHQMQISIDNVVPDDVSKKSLRVLDRKLRWLAAYAEFDVSINAVVGGGNPNPEEALAIARRAAELGLGFTSGVIHDAAGQLRSLGSRERGVLDQIQALRKPLFSFVRYNRFQEKVIRGLPNQWHCRAGSRYLYVCEDGLVHWCSQQRGTPAIPLERYTAEDLDREYHRVKGCAPFCTINCVHQTAVLDSLRENPRQAVIELLSPPERMIEPRELPASVRLLMWTFLDNRNKMWFSRAVERLFGIAGERR
jgi:MoaA/NifB/PqqE/SkfB family radical SAM enzyme